MQHRSVRVLVLFALVCACWAAAAGFARAAPPADVKPWTVALYVNADNDLEYTWPRFTLPALKRIPASERLNVVALVDKQARSGSYLYQVRGPEVTTVKHFTAERNFGKGETFTWFLRQVRDRFPSEHLIVVGWDHGYGWRYFSHDYASDDLITMPELRKALADAAVPVDILAFDACNMGDVEVAWDIASVDDPSGPAVAAGAAGSPLVDYLVASEETIDQDGYPYDGMFAPLAADSGRSPEQVADDMLRGWDGYYGSLRCFNWVSLSAIDLAAVRPAGPAMTELAGRLSQGLAEHPAQYGRAIRRAVNSSVAAWDSWQLDLGMFAGRLVDGHELDEDADLVAAAAAVRDAVNGSMVLEVTSGSYARWFQGLTVWMGTGDEWAEYCAAYSKQSLFGASSKKGGVGWYELLRKYQQSAQASTKLPEPNWPRATYGLTDVYFADQDHGWATGYDNVKAEAVVLRTGNGGGLWKTARPSDGGAYVAGALSATPGGRLWIAGSEGWDGALIAQSADQGATWRYPSVPTLQYVLRVEAVTNKVGFAVGTGGALLRTGNGGATWKKLSTAPNGDLLGMRFVSANEGWALANDRATTAGTVYRTGDGGKTWEAQWSETGTLLYAVDVVGEHLWVAGGDPSAGPVLSGERVGGDGVVLHSPDGGQTWETQWGDVAYPRVSDIHMVDEQVGWAVGDGSATQPALVLRTIDGGVTWDVRNPGVTFDLAAVYALDAQTAWVVGDGEQILKTTDGGVTWASTTGDVVGPRTKVKYSAAARGSRVSVRYVVTDARSDLAKVTIRISNGRGRVVKRRSLGWRLTGPGTQTFTLRCDLPRGTYTVKALAVDRARNSQSSAVTGKLRVR